MENFKGTKGKWLIGKPFKNNDGNIFIDINSENIKCDSCNSNSNSGGYLIARTFKNAVLKNEQIPNAKLIAMSPELLKVCQNALRDVKAMNEWMVSKGHHGYTLLEQDLEDVLKKTLM